MNIGEKDEIFNEFFYQIFHRSFVRIQFQRISFEKQERFRFLLLFFFFFWRNGNNKHGTKNRRNFIGEEWGKGGRIDSLKSASIKLHGFFVPKRSRWMLTRLVHRWGGSESGLAIGTRQSREHCEQINLGGAFRRNYEGICRAKMSKRKRR